MSNRIYITLNEQDFENLTLAANFYKTNPTSLSRKLILDGLSDAARLSANKPLDSSNQPIANIDLEALAAAVGKAISGTIAASIAKDIKDPLEAAMGEINKNRVDFMKQQAAANEENKKLIQKQNVAIGNINARLKNHSNEIAVLKSKTNSVINQEQAPELPSEEEIKETMQQHDQINRDSKSKIEIAFSLMPQLGETYNSLINAKKAAENCTDQVKLKELKVEYDKYYSELKKLGDQHGINEADIKIAMRRYEERN